jgi:hypothetical protein
LHLPLDFDLDLTKGYFYGNLVFLQDYVFAFIIEVLGFNSRTLNSLWPASINEFDIPPQDQQMGTSPLNGTSTAVRSEASHLHTPW